MVDKSKLKIKLRFSIIIIFALSAFFALYFSAFINGIYSFNLGTVFKSCIDNGFSFGAFFLISLFLSLLFILLELKHNNDTDFDHPFNKHRTISESDNYGKAEFEKPWQYRSVAQIRAIEDCRGHILGMLDDKGRQCIDYFPDPNDPKAHFNEHIFAIGASGSGKTFTVGKNYCYQSIKLGHSVIHTDPKGELYAELAQVYRKHGYVVRRLNFINPVKSDGWDCLKEIRTCKDQTQMEVLIGKFAAAFVAQLPKEDIFKTGPEMLMKALLLRLILDPNIPDKDKNIHTIKNWIGESDPKYTLDKLFNRAEMPLECFASYDLWSTFVKSAGNLYGNLMINLSGLFNSFSAGIVADILSTDDMDLSLPGRERCAYFIQFPVPNDAFRFPASLFFVSIFEALQFDAIQNPDRMLQRQVDFFLDEFPQIGYMPGWEQRMSVVRSYGINVFMITQTWAQLISIYKEYAAETIISNCATWLMLGANDLHSAQLFCSRIGQTTIDVTSESREKMLSSRIINGERNSKVTIASNKTSLLSPDEICKLPANSLLILFQRHNVIFANAVPCFLHPYDKEVEEIPEMFQPFFNDEDNSTFRFPTREERKKSECIQVKAGLKKYPDYFPPLNISDAPFKSDKHSPFSDILSVVFDDVKAVFVFLSKSRLNSSSESGVNSDTEHDTHCCEIVSSDEAFSFYDEIAPDFQNNQQQSESVKSISNKHFPFSGCS